MSDPPDTAPRIQWRVRDESGWRWGYAHTLTGPCPACSDRAPDVCPRCGGRLHREPVAVDGITHVYLCQDERTDREGRSQRTRSVESQAQLAARVAAERRQHRERTDRWIGRVLGGVLAVKVAFAVLFVLVVAVGIVTSL